MVFVNEKPAGKPEEWRTIDYEKGVILKRIGGLPYGQGDKFEFLYEGQIIQFIASDKNQYNEKGNAIV